MDIYSSTGIAVGTALWLCNRGNYIIEYAIKATEPTTERAGTILPNEYVYIDPNESGLFAIADGTTSLGVQEA